ncbi:MAG: hypothetical protein QOK00_1090 [Thermoleophilaceae bacterium]|jgi:thiol:disulfide interchange protein|nr:hypothetical protein [Thermoleophilaceae bacterium]MEA2400687.1 hypothetical protein [Thermoleophilaceae bacterium]
MHSAGARALREDDHEMSREAVLLQWERKIEAAERRDGGRFVRSSEEEAAAAVEAADPAEPDTPVAEPVPLRPTEDATKPEPRRFERHAPAQAVAERRTITITGHPTPARRRRGVVDAQLAQPDRIALWAFLLGLFLVAVAAGTAHA